MEGRIRIRRRSKIEYTKNVAGDARNKVPRRGELIYFGKLSQGCLIDIGVN